VEKFLSKIIKIDSRLSKL